MTVLPASLRGWLVAAVTIAFVALGERMVQQHRYDHRDEYVEYSVPWESFETSVDGRTLTFHRILGLSCGQLTAVKMNVDSDPVVATLLIRNQIVRNGHPLFCGGDSWPDSIAVHLDEPLEDGRLVVDGFEPSERMPDLSGCVVQQRVGDPVPQRSSMTRPPNCS